MHASINQTLSCTREVLDWILGNILHRKGCQGLGQPALGNGGRI